MDHSQLTATALPRLLAVEVLPAEPEALGDDVLETCLYILRDKLNNVEDGGEQRRSAMTFGDGKAARTSETGRMMAE